MREDETLEGAQSPTQEDDLQMAALDELTKRLLKVPKEELDAMVKDDLLRNRGTRRAKLS